MAGGLNNTPLDGSRSYFFQLSEGLGGFLLTGFNAALFHRQLTSSLVDSAVVVVILANDEQTNDQHGVPGRFTGGQII